MRTTVEASPAGVAFSTAFRLAAGIRLYASFASEASSPLKATSSESPFARRSSAFFTSPAGFVGVAVPACAAARSIDTSALSTSFPGRGALVTGLYRPVMLTSFFTGLSKSEAMASFEGCGVVVGASSTPALSAAAGVLTSLSFGG